MCQHCTAHCLHSGSRVEAVGSIQSLELESRVTNNPLHAPMSGAYCSWVCQAHRCPGSCYGLNCFSLSMWWHNFSAGPSFSPMYFIIMSLRSSIRAFPSISCFLNSSACGANAVGSASLTNCITSSIVQEEGFLLG